MEIIYHFFKVLAKKFRGLFIHTCILNDECVRHSKNKNGELIHTVLSKKSVYKPYVYEGTLFSNGMYQTGEGRQYDGPEDILDTLVPLGWNDKWENGIPTFSTVLLPEKLLTGRFDINKTFEQGLFQGHPDYWYHDIVFNGTLKKGKFHRGTYQKGNQVFIGELRVEKIKQDEKSSQDMRDKFFIKETWMNGILIEETNVKVYKNSIIVREFNIESDDLNE